MIDKDTAEALIQAAIAVIPQFKLNTGADVTRLIVESVLRAADDIAPPSVFSAEEMAEAAWNSLGAALKENDESALCEDCPPVGYPTNETRCLPCPRRPLPSPPTAGEV